MALRLEQKQAIVSEVAAVAAKAHSAIAAEYSGLTVEEMNQLRVSARKSAVYLRVIKNNLVKRAVADTEFACMQEALQGPLLYAFSQEDPGAAARVLKDFAKEHDRLVVKLISIGGKLLPPSNLDQLASLPTREEAIAQLMGLMKAPIAKFVRTLAEPHAKLVRTLAAVRDKKQAA